jgi:uncharacterized protein
MTYTTIMVPGLRNSGPDHWQTWLESQLSETIRVHQSDWNTPDITSWVENVKAAIQSTENRIIIVAHSFGVVASLIAASEFSERIAGALLVAPADPSRFTINGERINQDSLELQVGLYDLMPKLHTGYPTVIAASTNDHCMPFKRTAWWANTWGSKLVNLGNAGHVNADSGYGAWPQGLALYNELVKRSKVEDETWERLSRWAF